MGLVGFECFLELLFQLYWSIWVPDNVLLFLLYHSILYLGALVLDYEPREPPCTDVQTFCKSILLVDWKIYHSIYIVP